MSVVVSYSETRLIKRVAFAWISDGAGAATVTTKRLSGKIVRITIVPSAIDVPTENYTLRLNDEDGVDVLMGYGLAGLSATNTRTFVPRINDAVLGQPSYPIIVDGKLSFIIAGAGDTRAGSVSVYIE